MARFRADPIAGLCRQLTFSPREIRAVQVAAAEELLHLVEGDKTYPLDFVTYRVTGYRPKKISAAPLAGESLQHDLGLLIEVVSQTLDLHTRDIAEPVLSIQDVCDRFAVTAKTIQRWRRKGLGARKFHFPDGKCRVGFLLSSVERFLSVRRFDAVDGLDVSPLSPAQLAQILRRGRWLAAHVGCSADEIARRVGRRMHRSPLAVMHLLRKHDQENPRAAILPQAAAPLTAQQRALVLRCHHDGMNLLDLARSLACRRADVARVVLEERIVRIARRRLRYIDDPLYAQDDALFILCAMEPAEAIPVSAPLESSRWSRGAGSYVQDLCRAPLLDPVRERALFLRFNYEKRRFVQARRQLDPHTASSRDLRRLEGFLADATATKNRIVAANLRLVVSVARKHLRGGLPLMELISEGNITLMRAVESFDVHRGNRFSTYATLALMKGFARSVPQLQSDARTGQSRLPADMADTRADAGAHRVAEFDELRHLLGRLSERERRVLQEHYGLGRDSAAGGPSLGLSRQRARQIEQTALAKLRDMVGRPN